MIVPAPPVNNRPPVSNSSELVLAPDPPTANVLSTVIEAELEIVTELNFALALLAMVKLLLFVQKVLGPLSTSVPLPLPPLAVSFSRPPPVP